MSRRILPLLIITSLLTACAVVVTSRLDAQFGPADPARLDTPLAPPPEEPYAQTIQPLLNQRCVVCHACYDAPCQLKLGSWEGITRGASKAPVYDAARLREAEPTRLFTDAHLPSQWRQAWYSFFNQAWCSPRSQSA